MRRFAAVATVVVLVGTAAGVIAGAPSSSALGAKVTPGSIWTLRTAAGCESDSFATEHSFSSAVDYGTGDRGTWSGAKKITMTWTQGLAAGEVFKGIWRRSTGAYSGTYAGSGSSLAATLTPASSAGCAAVTTTPTVSAISLGDSDSDAVTVTGADGIAPTGTVTFYACGPDATATACTTTAGTEVGTPVGLTGSGSIATATSASFSPGSAGTYCFLGVYSGDTLYPSASDSSTTDECFTVGATGSSVTTAPGSASIVLGNSDTDTATVTGAAGDVAPTGTVTFLVCGPTDAATACNGPTAAGPGGTEVGSPVALTAVTAVRSTATSAPFTPTATGTYCFSALYSGDLDFTHSADNTAPEECFSVLPATPVVTTTPAAASMALGATDADNATVSGVDGIVPTGSVDFLVCPWSPAPCSATSVGAVDLGTMALAAGGDPGDATAASETYTPPSAGTYCFAALYSGDDNYVSAAAADAGECFTVTSTASSPLTLGSPENSFGTGALDLGAGDPTHIWAAVNGYCTSKENGDEFLSAFDGTWNGDGWSCSADHTAETPNATANYEYNGADGNAAGYSYDIVTPPSPSDVTATPITVQAYDPAYEPTQCPGQPAVDSADPFNPAGGQTPDLDAGGPDTSITTDYTLSYAPVPGDDAADVALTGPGTAPYVAASGDPATCGQWTTLFTIPAGSPDGYYRVQVSTPQSPGQASDGVNAYSLRVYQGDTFARCSTISTDAWYSPACPVIAGQTALSTYADEPGSTGSFYLAQVPASSAGGSMVVNLFDPGEGDKDIQLIDPDGNAVPFAWHTTDGCPLPAPNSASTDCAEDLGFVPLSGVGSALDVSGTISSPPGMESDSEFNDREVQLVVAVPADYTADNGGWWQIRYTSTNGTVQDRATWSVVLSSAQVTSAARHHAHTPAHTHAARRSRRSLRWRARSGPSATSIFRAS